jgi:hypothetical protein
MSESLGEPKILILKEWLRLLREKQEGHADTWIDEPVAAGNALDYITQLEAELAKAREDVERLDGMDKWGGIQWSTFNAMMTLCHVQPKVREAIDKLKENGKDQP